MRLDNCYSELNLQKGASLSEIKSAYRQMAKSYHPDAVGNLNSDPEKFSRASDAYRALLKEVMGALKTQPQNLNSIETTHTSQSTQPTQSTQLDLSSLEYCPYVFEAEKTEGLDIIYYIVIEKPENPQELKFKLPWIRREACPRCLGQGVTLNKQGQGFVYKPHSCSRCHGHGYVTYKTHVEFSLDSALLTKGKIRLQNAGLYLPKEGKRGDLLVSIRIADKLPTDN
ncbi:MAG: DnaJ domain-containing protein [Deltaproteobacteria bacterium]|jgi:DnaJ-class molecular chaperone|nr:DnaJ domain-containing protein [Deltaproteobacteria bacterium]